MTVTHRAVAAVGLLPFLLVVASAQDDELFRQVCPAPGELRWQKIAWETSLWGGVVEAHAQEKPILLWTMNGHPLGLT